MNESALDLSTLSHREMKTIAKQFNIEYSNISKTDLQKALEDQYYKVKKYVGYMYIKQLGYKGKDGRTFLARSESDGKEYAVKVFKDSKSPTRIKKEVLLQNIAASSGIAPHIVDYNTKGKYIVMDKLDKTLFEVFREQKGKLTKRQQRQIIQCFKQLDKCGIFHGDPNPCNFMLKDDKWYAIDFGFSKKIDDKVIKKHTKTPNMKYMPAGMILKFKSVHPDTSLDIFEKYSII
jgi:serine/threonine protein kinase